MMQQQLELVPLRRGPEQKKSWDSIPVVLMCTKIWVHPVESLAPAMCLSDWSLCSLLCKGSAVHGLLPQTPTTQSSTCSSHCIFTLRYLDQIYSSTIFIHFGKKQRLSPTSISVFFSHFLSG